MQPSPLLLRPGWTVSIVVMLLGFGSLCAAVSAQNSRSAPLARELATLLTQRSLDAYAVRNPDMPDEFIAALLFPNEQLLVVSARPLVPAAVAAQLADKRYADVYAALHQSSVADTKLFFQDMSADGLQARPTSQVDVQYEKVVSQTIFDGDASTHKLTENQYIEKFAAADSRYSSLLTALVADLKSASTRQ